MVAVLKRVARVVLGFNALALSHLIRLGPLAFARVCDKSFAVARQPLGIPEIELDTILGDRRPLVRLRVQRYEDGMLPSDQAMTLLAILVAEQPASILEIGTYMGHTTRLMAENLAESTIHTVDLPETFDDGGGLGSGFVKDDLHLIRRRVVGREFSGEPQHRGIRQHLADTAEWDFRAAGSPTFFFIDGSHTYEYCKNDSEKCLAIAREGPVVFVWHDCDTGHPGVVRCLMEWRRLGRDVRRIAETSLAYWKRA